MDIWTIYNRRFFNTNLINTVPEFLHNNRSYGVQEHTCGLQEPIYGFSRAFIEIRENLFLKGEKLKGEE